MHNDTTTAPTLVMNDFLAAFDLDRANIKTVDIYHEDGNLIIYLELNTREHSCPVCTAPTDKVKGYQLKKIKHSVLNPVPCIIHYRAISKLMFSNSVGIVDKLCKTLHKTNSMFWQILLKK